ncbi:alpha/beta fold hydrolase [Novosphingobium sp. MW5]|nr:alpha/beta fold hydrolase [Novosphingobium sp. MW5]
MSANVAILVHGTFASEATWIESDSALAQQLRNVMPEIECVPFRWSGANNHSARLAASDALAETIHDVADRYPRAAIHLVGHSHGGNVMLYASGKIGPRPKIATMSFLGTPFLIPVLREVVGRMAFAKYAAGFVFLFLGVFLSALVTVWASEHFPADTLAAGMFFSA